MAPLAPSPSERLNQIGNDFFGRGRYAEALACYREALAYDRERADPRALIATLGNLGNMCAVSGQRSQADAYYHEVLELQKRLGDEGGIGATLVNLGNLHADAGEWNRARAYYLEARDILDRLQDDHALAILHSDLGLVARETGSLEVAIEEYERSLQLMRRTGDRGGMADAYRMMARAYGTRQMWDEAVSCAQTSLDMAGQVKDDLRVAGAMYALAGFREQQGRIKEAISLFERVIEYDRQYQLPKLKENMDRLAALQARQAAEPATAPPPHLPPLPENDKGDSRTA